VCVCVRGGLVSVLIVCVCVCVCVRGGLVSVLIVCVCVRGGLWEDSLV